MLVLGVSTAIAFYLPPLIPGGSANGFLGVLVVIAAVSFGVRRRTDLQLAWCVAVPGAVAVALTAPFLHSGADVNGALVGAYVAGYSVLVGLAAAVGAVLAYRRH